MGIIPLFDWAKLTPFFYGKFTLINKARSRIKVFEPFEDSSKTSTLLVQFKSVMVVFLSDQVSQICNALELNL